MRSVFVILICCLLLATCKKNNEGNSSAICLDTVFLNTNIPDALEDVFFVNDRVGFVSGYQGSIYKTTDSGKTWINQYSTVNLPIYGLFFLDALNGFAVGGQNSCGSSGCIPPGGFILKTTDGGNTWVKVYSTSNKIEISSVYFVSPMKGFCAGDNVILNTSDGGQTWSEYKIDNLGGKMMQVRFSNQLKGFVICMFDKIVQTSDGGVTWQITSPHSNWGYYSISTAGSTIYVSGQSKIIKSTNEGASWTQLPNAPDDIFAIHFIDSHQGFAFGRGNYSGGDWGHPYGSIYCTIDGGRSWRGSADVTQVGLISKVSFPSKNIGYAISSNKVIRLTAN